MDEAFPWDPLQYPFEVPLSSFRWIAGTAAPLSSSVPVDELTTQRHAVLAIGSNASPAQLTRKFSDRRFMDPASSNGCIPVLTAVANGVDVVYGAHLAWYGALPATLLETPGACAHVFVTWLTSVQLERMNETEGLGHSYQLRRIAGVRSHGEEVDAAMSYVTIAGVSVLSGTPLGLASIQHHRLFVATRDAVPGVGSPFRRHGLWHEWQDPLGPRARLTHLAEEGRVAPLLQSPYGDTLTRSGLGRSRGSHMTAKPPS